MLTPVAPPSASLGPEGAVSVDESFLSGLGVHRIPTPVPFLEAGGPANAYAIEEEDGGFALFDCAVGTEAGLAALRQGLAERGLELARLRRIVVSHGHVDHYGNAQTLSEESGAKVFVHPADLDKICGEGRWNVQLERNLDFFRALGVPDATLQAMLAGAARAGSYARQVDPARVLPLSGGQLLRFRHFQAEVLHLPGHTPGLVCLHVPSHRLLFADDHVLARVSPNPLLDLSQGQGETKFKALVAYVESARRVHALELDCVLPGHGEAFKGHRALLDGLMTFYRQRQDRLLKRLRESKATVHELVKLLFPRVDVGRMYLMLSEVMGNVEVLESQGRISRELQDGVFRFTAT